MQSVPFDLLRCCTLEIFEVPAEARKYVPFSKYTIEMTRACGDLC